LKFLAGLLPTRGQVASARSLFADWTLLRWAALPVADRRWTAPLSATAVGMGLFIGVAMGPGIGQTVGAAGAVIQLPATTGTGPDQGNGHGATADAGPPPLASPVANTPAAPPPSSSAGIPSTTPAVAPPVPAPAPTTTPETPTTTTTPDDTSDTPPPPDQEPLTFKGTVMHVNDAAESFVLTTGKGQMNAIHAKKLPETGTKLEVPVRELANGTYAEDGKEKRSGSAKKVKFQGLVTYSDTTSGVYTVSRKGASVLVHQDPAAQPPPEAPAIGAQLTVSATIDNPPADDDTAPAPGDPVAPPTTTTPTTTVAAPSPCGTPPEPPPAPETILTELSHTVDIEFLGYSEFEGIVQGVCADTGELILSADDLRESGADLTLPLGEDTGIDLAAIEPGDVVDASAVIEEETSALSLTGISSDQRIKGADDPALAQGDQAG
jgi:hypothetical protein